MKIKAPKELEIYDAQEFIKRYGDKPGKFARMIDTEVGPESEQGNLRHVIGTDYRTPSDFSKFLWQRDYTSWFLHWPRGEDMTRAKKLDTPAGEQKLQRHGKIWFVNEGSDGGIYSTWHTDPWWISAMLDLVNPYSDKKQAEKHARSAGHGDYRAGTEGFVREDIGYQLLIAPGSYVRTDSGLWMPSDQQRMITLP
ncbi:MAG: hypothetical protein HY832_02040 [Candidatus Aenigmarchaeota archaeon]|nr:hypothetical protein [Candidatus Aenigmarchaeota archaeon]